MNRSTLPDFDPVTPRPKWDGLARLNEPSSSEPPLPVLADFIHHCSPDPAVRTNAVTHFVMSVWQLAGRKLTSRLPSIITVTPDQLHSDSGSQLAADILNRPTSGKPRIQENGLFACGTPEHAPGTMANALLQQQEHGPRSPFQLSGDSSNEEIYVAAQKTGFGYGPTRNYANGYHDVFQFVTDSDDQVILRLEEDKDRQILQKDILSSPRKFQQPMGYGAGLKLVPKHVALSGSLTIGEWDSSLAAGLINTGWPILILPGVSQAKLNIQNQSALANLALLASRYGTIPIDEPANLIPEPWFDAHSKELRARLHHLPDTYEYSILKMVRQLFPVCFHIANWFGQQSGSSTKEIIAITNELCEHTTHSLVLSIKGLAWHGLGIDAGCPTKKLTKVLEHLRTREPMTKSELLRSAHLKKEERDRIVKTLEKENLIQIHRANNCPYIC